jgi:fatty acid elongase 3
MFVGLSVSVVAKVQKDGPFSLLCDAPASTSMTRGALSYWMWHYAVSKNYELVDTFLMVARRRPLTVLHLWHHSSIGPLSLSWLLGSWTLAWLGAWLNTGIHVAMYFYYFASSRYGYQPPWKRLITTAQIAQFFTVFFTITVFCLFYVGAGWNGVIWMTHTLSLFGTSVSFPLPYLSFPPQCAGDQLVVFGSQAVNVSFLVLFINFYIQTYRSGKTARAAKKRD